MAQYDDISTSFVLYQAYPRSFYRYCHHFIFQTPSLTDYAKLNQSRQLNVDLAKIWQEGFRDWTSRLCTKHADGSRYILMSFKGNLSCKVMSPSHWKLTLLSLTAGLLDFVAVTQSFSLSLLSQTSSLSASYTNNLSRHKKVQECVICEKITLIFIVIFNKTIHSTKQVIISSLKCCKRERGSGGVL